MNALTEYPRRMFWRHFIPHNKTPASRELAIDGSALEYYDKNIWDLIFEISVKGGVVIMNCHSLHAAGMLADNHKYP